MKKTGLLLLLLVTMAAAQQAAPDASGVVATSTSVPVVRFQTPTAADLYCAGFISQQRVPNANFVDGGLQTPAATKFTNGEIVYLAGTGYQQGQQYTIVRELRDVNEYELYPGQTKMVKATGQPYAEIGRVRVLDTRSHSAVAQVEFSCDPINPGDIAIPFAEKQPIAFHAPIHFDRFAPASGKLSGRIVRGKDFDGTLGTGAKVYMNFGSNQGVKAGDYFRAVRPYSADLRDPVDSLSFKASTSEDTQRRMPSFEAKRFTRTNGPDIHVADLPRRAVGEVVILSVTPTTSTGMVVFALEDVHAGDTVELDEQQ
ncbi:MAG: hypothetical protein HY233_00350 [Acidobacteriales bacterium]|nr:hypothetical protein [Candidatus Koribacter versatilis]MBI3644409.1 hypothetical protein [Terriglobales bacterium]